jgi:hypothetical protein
VCAAHGHAGRDPTWPRPALLGEPAAARRRCAGSGRGAAAHRRGNGGRRRDVDGRGFGQDDGAVGTTARSAKRSGRRHGRRGGGRDDDGVREAVGAAAARARRGAVGRRAARARRLLGRAACCPDSGFKPRHWGGEGAREAGRCWEASGACEAAVGRRATRARRLSGRAASAWHARHVAATRQRRAATRARRGARRLTGGSRSSAISE